MKLVTAAQMQDIERRVDAEGLALSALMQLAGAAVADASVERSPHSPILVLVGPGNNGGDGLVAARRLAERGRNVFVYAFRRSKVKLDGTEFCSTDDDAGSEMLSRWVRQCDVIVDALLGVGQTRPMEGVLGNIITCVNTQRNPESFVLAVDVPTGVDADTGRLLGDAIRADTTVCMGFLKPGLVTYPGAGYSGYVELDELGIPRFVADDILALYPEDADIAARLPAREIESNKGTYGRVLVVGGSVNYAGAPSLVTLGAYRAGAGLVEVLTPDEVQRTVANHVLECIFAPGARPQRQLGPDCMRSMAEASEHARAAVFGPGMNQTDETRDLTQSFLDTRRRTGTHPPAVVDADALNNLSTLGDWWEGQQDLVLTPHPGEMGRLIGSPVSEIQKDRLDVALRAASRWGQVVILKGAGTV
ncbi:MAG: NAD(P)H-hydrate epimerase, partial [Chloroflexi bacterium]